MESLLSVVTTFGLSTEDIEGTIIVFVAFMATALSIGGIAFSFKIADVATKTIYQKGMSMVRGAGRAVATPVKGAAKVMGKGMVEDFRNDIASGYDPNNKGSARNAIARIAAGAVTPGRRSQLKVAARGRQRRVQLNDLASAELTQRGLDTGSDIAIAMKAQAAGTPSAMNGLDLRDEFITEQLAGTAIKTGDSEALRLLMTNSQTNKTALQRAYNREWSNVKGTAAGINEMMVSRPGDVVTGFAGAQDASGEITPGTPGTQRGDTAYGRHAVSALMGVSKLNGLAIAQQDTPELKMARDVMQNTADFTHNMNQSQINEIGSAIQRLAKSSAQIRDDDALRAALQNIKKADNAEIVVKDFAARVPTPPPPAPQQVQVTWPQPPAPKPYTPEEEAELNKRYM